jgi:hypothetical protein
VLAGPLAGCLVGCEAPDDVPCDAERDDAEQGEQAGELDESRVRGREERLRGGRLASALAAAIMRIGASFGNTSCMTMSAVTAMSMSGLATSACGLKYGARVNPGVAMTTSDMSMRNPRSLSRLRLERQSAMWVAMSGASSSRSVMCATRAANARNASPQRSICSRPYDPSKQRADPSQKNARYCPSSVDTWSATHSSAYFAGMTRVQSPTISASFPADAPTHSGSATTSAANHAQCSDGTAIVSSAAHSDRWTPAVRHAGRRARFAASAPTPEKLRCARASAWKIRSRTESSTI